MAIDNDYGVWQAFANHYWPALYFIDAEGRIRHHRFGEGDYERSEGMIQELLRRGRRPPGSTRRSSTWSDRDPRSRPTGRT